MYNYPSRPGAAWLILAVSVAAVLPAALAQQQSEEMQIVIAAEQLVQQQKPDEALAELQKIFDKTDSFAPAYYVAGFAYSAKGQPQEAFDSFVKAAEYRPGWGEAHRQASMYAADMDNFDASWEHAIKAHQAGTDMSDAFAGLQTMADAPEDLEAQLAAYRVFIGPFDTTVFEESGDTALQGGASGSASGRTDRAGRIVREAVSEILTYQQEARKQFAESRSFGLVQRQDQAQYIFVTAVDSLQDNMSRRRMRAIITLVDARSGEEAYRRRVDFSNIVSRGDLNRDFTQLMKFMEEWAAERQR